MRISDNMSIQKAILLLVSLLLVTSAYIHPISKKGNHFFDGVTDEIVSFCSVFNIKKEKRTNFKSVLY